MPEDLAVIGYDDIHLAALVTPALTTCRVDREALGGRAATLLLEHLSPSSGSGFCDCETVTLQPKLILRASAP